MKIFQFLNFNLVIKSSIALLMNLEFSSKCFSHKQPFNTYELLLSQPNIINKNITKRQFDHFF